MATRPEQRTSILWIGGSPCAGKTSISRLLAHSYGLTVYHCDDAYERHVARATPTAQPLLYRLTRLTWDEIWSRPHGVQVAEEVALYREEFPMILDDLRGIASSPSGAAIIAEGTALLPECVAPLLEWADRALWIVPTESFQRTHYAHRPWVEGIIGQCADPAGAFAAWMARDAAFARLVADDASRRGLPVVVVDGSQTLAETARSVGRVLGLDREQ